MTTQQYINFRDAIRSALAYCNESLGHYTPHDVLQVLKEHHPAALASVQERLADIGCTQEIRRFMKKPPLIDTETQLSFLPAPLRQLPLSPNVCCPPADADFDAEDWGRFPWAPLARVTHTWHARYLELLRRGIIRDQQRLKAHQTLHSALAPYVQGDEPYEEVCKRLPIETQEQVREVLQEAQP